MEVLDKLFPFQREDVEAVEKYDAIGIFNEMGTGKTYEAIALDQLRRESTKHYKPKTLVVAPLSVTGSWEDHFRELTDLRIRRIDPKNRHKFLQNVDDVDVFILHWEALRLMPSLKDMTWCHIIADECHRAKNRKAQQTKALKKIPAKYKTAMSGTPMVNRPDELWSILHWLYPQAFRSYWRFYKRYVEYDMTPQGYYIVKGPKNVQELQEMISDFTVRRLKRDVLKDLPDKYYTNIWVDLGPQQRKAYDAMRRDMIAWVGAQEDKPLVAPVVIAQLIRLQQFALGSAELDAVGQVSLSLPSSKVDALMEILDEAPDQQVVVFTQFKQMVRLVEQQLTKKGISYCTLTGDVPQAEREQNIRDFQAGKCRVFIGTIGAGGIGITLTAASTLVFLDRAWSPAANLQAEDRLHRVGQKEAVQIIDIMARNTVDLGRKQKIEQKWEWIKAILGDD